MFTSHPVATPLFRSSILSRQAKRGFSLIEVLVSIIILTFGLLGVAGLLVKGVSNATASEASSRANYLMADMADRIRANPAAALSGTSQYAITYSDVPPTITATSTIAQKDVKVWLDALAAQLPNGDGRITITPAARQVVLEVRWNKCYGVLNDTDTLNCKNNADTTYATSSMEVRL